MRVEFKGKLDILSITAIVDGTKTRLPRKMCWNGFPTRSRPIIKLLSKLRCPVRE